MGQLTKEQFKEFHKNFQTVAPVIEDVKDHIRYKNRSSLTNTLDTNSHSSDDYDFYQELYSRGYKLVKV